MCVADCAELYRSYKKPQLHLEPRENERYEHWSFCSSD